MTLKTEPVTVGADATEYVWFMGLLCVQIQYVQYRTYIVASATAATGLVFMGRLRLLLHLCAPKSENPTHEALLVISYMQHFP